MRAASRSYNEGLGTKYLEIERRDDRIVIRNVMIRPDGEQAFGTDDTDEAGAVILARDLMRAARGNRSRLSWWLWRLRKQESVPLPPPTERDYGLGARVLDFAG